MSEFGDDEHLNLGHYEGQRNEKHQRHGLGKSYYSNGDTYEGLYDNGRKQGKGHYRWSSSGAVYEGGYYANRKSGQGWIVYPDGSKYEGEWENDVRQGKGTYAYSNGDTYTGQWEMNVRHGRGVYTDKATGTTTNGVWHHGKLHGPVKILMADHFYEGAYYNNVMKGCGRFTFPKMGVEQIGRHDLVDQERDSYNEDSFTALLKKSVWRVLQTKAIDDSLVC